MRFLFGMTVLFALFANAAPADRSIGAITCVYQTADAVSADCMRLPDGSAYSCSQNESDRKLINEFILAPQVCFDNPMYCEGAEINLPVQVSRTMGRAILTMNYSSTFNLTLAVGDITVRQESMIYNDVESDARVANLAGTNQSIAIETQVGQDLFHVVCHAFTASHDEIKRHTESQLREKLKQHFFKQ